MPVTISKPGNLVREEPVNGYGRADDIQQEIMPVLHEMKKHPNQWVIVASGKRTSIGHVRHKLLKASWLPGRYEFTSRVMMPEKKEAKLYGRYVGSSGR